MLIGLSGKRGAGKDSVASALVADYGFTRIAFADALKQMLRAINPTVRCAVGHGGHIPLDDLVAIQGWDLTKQDLEVRRLLQRAGQWMFNVDPLFWVKAAAQSMEPCRDYVITDLRFDHELRWLRGQGGLVVRIHRTDHVVLDADRSETEADAWAYDVVLNNTPGKTDPAYLANLLMEEVRELASATVWAT